MKHYDVVILGSGLGGLASGAIMAREGKSVCVLEKNKQIGGNLQTFVRNKVIFDSGVHYVGGMDKGQNLYQLFRFLGIMDKLKARKMDEDCFDAIIFEGDPVYYKYAQGYDNFIRTLSELFPGEEEAIHKYCEVIKDVCSKFPMYNLRTGDFLDKVGVLEIDTRTFIESLTANVKLQNVLAGTNLLYAGTSYKTPLYVHALIVNSYIESSWRFIDGGSQIGRYLSREITSRGGVVLKHKTVTRLVEEGGRIQYVETDKGERFYGDLFISNIHPVKTMEMTQSDLIKKAYRSRLKSLDNSVSTFYINIVLKKNTMKYLNFNTYFFVENDTWAVANYTEENWPKGFALFFTAEEEGSEYAHGVTVMTYMQFQDVIKWKDTFNTVSEEVNRGSDYDTFKEEKAQKLLDSVEARFPGFRDTIESYYTASPLTIRDYIGTDDGSLYGFVKDCREPMKTFLSPRTKIPNLFLTGQNLNLHGVLGVTVSAVVTCSEILGLDYLINKIRNA